MNKRQAFRGVLLALASAVLAGNAAFSQQKYRFQENSAVGDVSVSENTMEMTLDVKVTANGQELPPIKFLTREREKYTDEVLAVSKNQPTTVRRTYEIARGVETGPDGMQKPKVSTLQGKVITIRVEGDKVTLAPAKGKLAPEDEKAVVDEFKQPDSPFFPDREVAPGEEWTVDPKVVAQTLNGIDKGEVKGKFEDVVPYGGRQCARIAIDISVQGQPGGVPVPMTMKGTGKGYYALDFMRPLDLEMSGPITMKGDTEQNGVKLQFDGEGTLVKKDTRRWVKVAGRPVR